MTSSGPSLSAGPDGRPPPLGHRGTAAGVGIGWRFELAELVAAREDIGFVEVMAEHVEVDYLPPVLRHLRSSGRPVTVHSVSMSLGEAAPLRRRAVEHAARVADRLDAQVVSDHIAFIGAGGIDSGHLLPLPRTAEVVDLVAEHAEQAAAVIGRPFALENPAALIRWPEDEMSETDFLTAVHGATGLPLILDVSNLSANLANQVCGQPEAQEVGSGLPLAAVAYAHLGGGRTVGGRVHDTHAHPLTEDSVRLLAALRRAGLDAPVLLERDDRFLRDEIERDLDRLMSQ